MSGDFYKNQNGPQWQNRQHQGSMEQQQRNLNFGGRGRGNSVSDPRGGYHTGHIERMYTSGPVVPDMIGRGSPNSRPPRGRASQGHPRGELPAAYLQLVGLRGANNQQMGRGHIKDEPQGENAFNIPPPRVMQMEQEFTGTSMGMYGSQTFYPTSVELPYNPSMNLGVQSQQQQLVYAPALMSPSMTQQQLTYAAASMNPGVQSQQQQQLVYSPGVVPMYQPGTQQFESSVLPAISTAWRGLSNTSVPPSVPKTRLSVEYLGASNKGSYVTTDAFKAQGPRCTHFQPEEQKGSQQDAKRTRTVANMASFCDWHPNNACTCANDTTWTEQPKPQVKAQEIVSTSQFQRQQPEAEIIALGERIKQADEAYQKKLAAMWRIQKVTYSEDPDVAGMSEQEVAAIRLQLNDTQVSQPKLKTYKEVNPLRIPNPVTSFIQCFKPYPHILEVIARQGFKTPTPIQCQLWPCLMSGLDTIGIAQTGSGKTLGFMLPAMLHIERQRGVSSGRSPVVLVLGPTRELVQQIDKEVSKYKYPGITSVCIYGGASRGDQRDEIENLPGGQPPDIVIATPGRLNDFVQANVLDLEELSYLVLDEADEMLDQGFEPQINKALCRVRPDRQTCLTSATWPESVRRMANNYMKDPVLVVIGSLDLSAVSTVEQRFAFVQDDDAKFEYTMNLIVSNPDYKVIIFVGKKAMADHLSNELMDKSVKCEVIHGGLDQKDREQAIADMRSGRARVLVATDVVARGIDLPDITHVVNYDMPREIERYVHRIGRTGRAGRKGKSWTLLTWRDRRHAELLIPVLERSGQPVPQELHHMQEYHKNHPPPPRNFNKGGGKWDNFYG